MDYANIANRYVVANLRASKAGAVTRESAKVALKSMNLSEVAMAVEKDPCKSMQALLERLQTLTMGKLIQFFDNSLKIENLYNPNKIPGGQKVKEKLLFLNDTPIGEALYMKLEALINSAGKDAC